MTSHDTNGPMSPERTQALLESLARSTDGRANIVAFTESHAMLVVRVKSQAGETITLMCGGCTRVESNTRWRVGRLEYGVASTAPYRYRLTDSERGFLVECGVILVAEHPDDWKRAETEA